ncbi:MAG: hypothetical protein ACR2QB_09730 [Gammaproteobacteria bacterium]
MIDPREERELEAYLAGESPVSKRYAQGSADMPPPELDAAILAAAETELKVVPLQRKWRRWGQAVGIAASILLAVTLVLQMTIQPGSVPEVSTPEMFDQLQVDSETGSESKAAGDFSRSEQSSADPGVRMTEELRGSPALEVEQMGRADVAKQSDRRVGTQGPKLSGLPESAPDIAAPDEEALIVQMRRPEVNPQDEPAAVATYSDEDADLRPLPAEDSVKAALPAASMAASPEADKSEADGSVDLTAAVAMIREYQARGRLAAVREDQHAWAKEERQAPDGGAPNLNLEEVVVTSRKRVDPDAAVTRSNVEGQQFPLDPEQQLAEILRQYDAGDLTAADRLLSDFRRQYPAHAVSVSLADERN